MKHGNGPEKGETVAKCDQMKKEFCQLVVNSTRRRPRLGTNVIDQQFLSLHPPHPFHSQQALLMRPWERRLRDLAQLLRNCGETYFSPDRFRQNTNQFLQTSRTVTFLIQKNKGEIPGFEAWYKAQVLLPWATDSVMSWAKNARNVIEKEGDLEMQSTLQIAVLYSYESDEDMVLEVTRDDLLRASIDRLRKAALIALPPPMAASAVLKIQRRWVANTLPDTELIYGLTYAYSQLHHVCTNLATHLGSELDSSVPHPTSIDPSTGDVSRVRFMKLDKPGLGRHRSVRIDADPNFQPSPALLKLKEELKVIPKPSSLADIVSIRAKMAEATFNEHGNHIPMLALYDKNWNQIDFLSTALADQSDKYLFWRNVADRAFYQKAYAMVWTCESWLRDFENPKDRQISELPIVGEQLNVVGVDATGIQETISWDIARPALPSPPKLVPLEPGNFRRQPGEMFFLRPVVAAMKLVNQSSAG